MATENDELVSRLRLAFAMACNDDQTKVGTRERERHVFRTSAIQDAADEVEKLREDRTYFCGLANRYAAMLEWMENMDPKLVEDARAIIEEAEALRREPLFPRLRKLALRQDPCCDPARYDRGECLDPARAALKQD